MDASFATAKFPSYTTVELATWIADGRGSPAMAAELARREAVEAGDVSQMTPGERLRRLRNAEAV